jgi:hypothetical protein
VSTLSDSPLAENPAQRISRTRLRTRFDEDCPNLLTFGKPIHMRMTKSHTIHDLGISALIDTSFKDIWSLGAVSLLEYQYSRRIWDSDVGNYINYHPYVVLIERARLILDLRSSILDVFEGIEA